LTSTDSTNIAARRGSTAIEGNSIFKFESYYYLFVSWDKCCSGTNSTYNIRVGRSLSVSGPYVDKAGVALTNGGGSLLLGSHGSIIGPGGQDGALVVACSSFILADRLVSFSVRRQRWQVHSNCGAGISHRVRRSYLELSLL
jgi:hypothetical protein